MDRGGPSQTKQSTGPQYFINILRRFWFGPAATLNYDYDEIYEKFHFRIRQLSLTFVRIGQLPMNADNI